MQTIVQHISRLFVSYNDYLATKIDSVDKKALDKLLHEGFLKNQSILETPKATNRKKTSYQNFFALKRKQLAEERPNLGFGEISKLISTEWRSMSKNDKDAYKNIVDEPPLQVDMEEKTTKTQTDSSVVFEVNQNHVNLKKPMDSSIERYFIENSDDSENEDLDDEDYDESAFIQNNIDETIDDHEDNDDLVHDGEKDEDDNHDEDEDECDDNDDGDLDSLNFTFDDE